jgi:tripartite-type tricarboxylate transporter receptor subunit TctC
MAPSRAAAIPAVPSATETDFPALQTAAWSALFFPKATPKSFVERINVATDAAMCDPTVAKRLAELGADLPAPEQRTPQALGNLVRTELDKWMPLIRAAGDSL